MPGAKEPREVTCVLPIAQEDPPQRSVREEVPPEKVFVKSLRELVREELNKGQNEAGQRNQDLGPLQVVFLVAFVLDISLLYLMIPGGNQVWDMLGKLLPALGGTLAVSYFDRLRRWLFGHSSNPKLGFPLLVLFVLLLVLRTPIYSLLIQLDHPDCTVEVDGTGSGYHQQGQRTFLTGLNLHSHQISVQQVSSQSQTSKKAEYRIGWTRLLTGTVARLPLFRNLSFKPLVLTPPCKVDISTPPGHGKGILYVGAPEGFDLDKLGFTSWNASRAPVGTCSSLSECWARTVANEDFIDLPEGDYTFVEKDDECSRKPKFPITTISSAHQTVEFSDCAK